MKIIKSHLNKKSWSNNGVCFKSREKELIVDTIIIHSTYLSNEMLFPKQQDKNVDIQKSLSELFSFLNEEKLNAEKWNSTIKKIDNLIGLACKENFIKKNVNDTYSVNGIKTIFEYLGVSAHYIIGRNGDVFEIVNPNYKAFHAGKSLLPNSNRKNVNEFSIGIEILSSADDKILDLQYISLKDLVLKLIEEFPIANIYGHSDIAIPKGRKIDPIRFNWKYFKKLLVPKLNRPINYPSV